jgi:TPR repeat protein
MRAEIKPVTAELAIQVGQLENVEGWLSAAREGRVEALYNLGLLYSTGQGVKADLVEAHKWFNLAAMRGNEDARACRASLAQEMRPEEIAEAQRQARQWLQTH